MSDLHQEELNREVAVGASVFADDAAVPQQAAVGEEEKRQGLPRRRRGGGRRWGRGGGRNRKRPGRIYNGEDAMVALEHPPPPRREQVQHSKRSSSYDRDSPLMEDDFGPRTRSSSRSRRSGRGPEIRSRERRERSSSGSSPGLVRAARAGRGGGAAEEYSSPFRHSGAARRDSRRRKRSRSSDDGGGRHHRRREAGRRYVESNGGERGPPRSRRYDRTPPRSVRRERRGGRRRGRRPRDRSLSPVPSRSESSRRTRRRPQHDRNRFYRERMDGDGSRSYSPAREERRRRCRRSYSGGSSSSPHELVVRSSRENQRRRQGEGFGSRQSGGGRTRSSRKHNGDDGSPRQQSRRRRRSRSFDDRGGREEASGGRSRRGTSRDVERASRFASSPEDDITYLNDGRDRDARRRRRRDGRREEETRRRPSNRRRRGRSANADDDSVSPSAATHNGHRRDGARGDRRRRERGQVRQRHQGGYKDEQARGDRRGVDADPHHRQERRHHPNNDDVSAVAAVSEDDDDQVESPARKEGDAQSDAGGEAGPGGEASSGDDRDDEVGHFRGGPGTMVGDRYEIIKDVGKGTFGRVVECYDLDRKKRRRGRSGDKQRSHCRTVAIKIVRDVKRYYESALIEADILNDVNSRGGRGLALCAQMLDRFDVHGHYCLVFECLGRSLYDFLKRHDFVPFPLYCVRDIAEQLLDALEFLHGFGLIHTDLKPENILFVSNDEGTYLPPRSPDGGDTSSPIAVPASTKIKVIDFGGATYDYEKKSSIINTRQYRAPEVILELGWSTPSDLWSAGCIISELYTGDLLFATHDNIEHLGLIERAVGPFPRDMIRRSPPEAGLRDAFDSSGHHRLQMLKGTSQEHVRRMLSISDMVYDADRTSGLVEMLESLLQIDPRARVTAGKALKSHFLRSSFAS